MSSTIILPAWEQKIADVSTLAWYKRYAEKPPRDEKKNYYKYRYFSWSRGKVFTCKHCEFFTPWCMRNEGIDDVNGYDYRSYMLSNNDIHFVCKKNCLKLIS